MKTINKTESIHGGVALGPFGEAVAIGATIYQVPGIINGTTTQEWGQQVGTSVGETIYNWVNPNPVGQTVYYAEDFGLSYIAPTPFN